MTRSIRVVSVRRFQRSMPGVSEITTRLFSTGGDHRPPSLRPSRPRLSLASFVSPNNENTTRRDFWTKCVRWTVVAWKGTLLRDPPRREDGAKTSFVRLFRGKVFRDESTHFARTNDARVRGSGS